jgi:hypothetical protein
LNAAALDVSARAISRPDIAALDFSERSSYRHYDGLELFDERVLAARNSKALAN